MNDDKNVLISLGDSRMKQISEVLANKTCNKILEFLSDEDATVTEIANHLDIPINTTDYNVKKLVSAGLIESSSHFWSTKGKRMPTYKVSNRKIIISPKKTKNVIVPLLALAFTGITALILKKFMIVKETVPVLVQRANEYASLAASQTPTAADTVVKSSNLVQSLAAWEWFLIGAWFAILIFYVFSIIDERRRNRK